MSGFDLRFFENNNYKRKKCPKCGSHYWTQDAEQKNCGDAPCQEYTFLDNKLTDREYSIDEMREAFLGFFEKHGHSRLERYPVAARWRNDIYLTIASIADFQPHVTSGKVKPPANPLVISQPCIRLNDLDSVGRTGRHLTEFEMLGHHVFNSREKGEIYWKEETVKYCHEFLESIGMKGESYKESIWIGGGNAGACLEVVKGGLEVATLVFMDKKEDPDGAIEIKGEKYSPNQLKIVDTGYGLERFVWASQEKPTIYDALYSEEIEKVRKNSEGVPDVDHDLLGLHATLTGLMDIEKVGLRGIRKELLIHMKERGREMTMEELEAKLVPMEKVYTVVDHSRSVAFMLGDGIVPSNVKAGYLARLVIRRTLRLLEDLKTSYSLADLVGMHLEKMGKGFPDIPEKREHIMKVLELETERYADTVKRGKKMVRRIIKDMKREKEKEMPVDTLLDLYDTHGLHPTIVQDVTREMGVEMDIPDEFNNLIAERHTPAVKEKKEEKKLSYPKTTPLYYRDENIDEFRAVVLGVESDNGVILDKTAFYPEGGGQPNDTGKLLFEDEVLSVTDVQKSNGVIVHTIGSLGLESGTKLKKGDIVTGIINMERRKAHMRHHTATHVVLEAAKRILGPHIWQTGSSFTHKQARYDITHYRRITKGELKKIGTQANKIVLEGHPVTKEFLARDEAERRYGFRLYQGGAPKADVIRVVRTGTEDNIIDVEACGGTHVSNTMECGMIKLLRVTNIQDGVERLDYTAGLATVESVREMEDLLDSAADTINVARPHLPKTVARFFREWKERGKEINELKEKVALAHIAALIKEGEKIGEFNVISGILDMDMKGLQMTAKDLTEKEGTIVILGGENGMLLAARSKDVDVHMGNIFGNASKELGGKGGGRPNMAQGKFPDVGKAVKGLKEVVRKVLS